MVSGIFVGFAGFFGRVLRLPSLLFLVVQVLLYPLTAVAAPSDPKTTVESAVAEIVTILTDEGLAEPAKEDERYGKVVGVVEKFFDFNQISMRTLGPRWRELTPNERVEFVALFKKFLERNYIERVDGYAGQQVEIKGQEIRSDSRGNSFAMVSTDFLMQDRAVPVNYRLLLQDGRWMVYDVDVEGVSLVRNFRTQFDPYPFPELVRRMEESVATGEELEQK